MKKALVIIPLSLLLSLNVYAAPADLSESFDDEVIEIDEPAYIGIATAGNSLKISASGNASCLGTTTTLKGYTAKTVAELQRKKNGTWSTLKLWSATGETNAIVSKSYLVAKGYSYRLKVTHSTYDSSGKQVEEAISYSGTKNY